MTYEDGGMLAYDELLVGVLTRAGRALRVTVPQIWVSTEASAAGGRELWAIPKDIATFTPDDGALLGQVARPGSSAAGKSRAARDDARGRNSAVGTQVRLPDGAPLLRVASRVGAKLFPGLRLTLTTAQRTLADQGEPGVGSITSRNSVLADLRRARVRWDVARTGPLAWLAGRRPLVSLALSDAVIAFGRHVTR